MALLAGGLLVAAAAALGALRARQRSELVLLVALPEQELRRLVREQPGLAGARTALGVQLRRAGKLEQARPLLEQATQLAPDSADAWHALALCQRAQKQYPAAVSSLEKAVELEPGDPDLLRDLGSAYESNGQRAEAARCYERALDLNPHDSLSAYHLAACYLDYKDFADHQRRIERAVELAQRNLGRTPDTLTLEARAREVLGDLEGAEAAYWQVLALDPGHAVAIHRLGTVLMQRGEVETGRKLVEAGQAAMRAYANVAYLNEQARQQPQNPEAHLRLAQALRSIGDEARAQWHLRECLRLDPNNAEARRALGPGPPAPRTGTP
ncbi:MAG: tetratricopeptide repeat protein [Armatimonadota bacterium]